MGETILDFPRLLQYCRDPQNCIIDLYRASSGDWFSVLQHRSNLYKHRGTDLPTKRGS